MTKILIPQKNLKEGFEKQVQHIETLIESSEILYDSKKFVSSLPFSILALEEITKLRLIRQSIINKKGITEKDWKEMKKGGSHSSKLMKPSKDRNERLASMSEEKFYGIEQFKKITGDPYSPMTFPEMKNQLTKPIPYEKLNEIKKDCFYFDWNGKKWISAKLILSKQQLEALSFYVLETSKWFLNSTLLYVKYPTISTDPKSESFTKYINDPLRKKDVEFRKSFLKPKIKKKFLIAYEILKKY